MKIFPKKSLGQNFLIDRNILEKIVNVTQIENKTILEVGPGTGNLTSFILKKKPKKIFVVEKDDNLVNKLNDTFKDQLTIINVDVLKIKEFILKNKEKFIDFKDVVKQGEVEGFYAQLLRKFSRAFFKSYRKIKVR